jgi:hypothetical protein
MSNKPSSNHDFDAQAVTTANYIAANLFEAHRGALLWHNGLVVAFGNDGYTQDKQMRQEVVHLREELTRTKLAPTELGFGIDSKSGYSWAMILRPNRRTDPKAAADWLNATVWASFGRAFWDPLRRFKIGDAPRVIGVQGCIATRAIEAELNGHGFNNEP